jgi:uncharacterized membrane protein YgdD (TMEM256/DUF423 family)
MARPLVGRSARSLILAAATLAVLLLPATAHAQCTKDTDCKGNRVCRMGACEDPLPAQPAPYPAPQPAPYPAAPAYAAPAAPTAPPAYYAPPPAGYAPPQPAYVAPAVAPPPAVRSDPGWAAGAATYGIISGVVALGLAIGAEATKEDTIPAAPLGGVATALFAASLPIVAIGGSSARGHPSVTGSLGLRIAGWIAYGVTLADAAYLLSQVGQGEVDDGLILSVGLLGTAAMACFVVDARLSAAEAARLQALESQGGARASWRSGGVLVPMVLRAPGNAHRLAAGLAWAARF